MAWSGPACWACWQVDVKHQDVVESAWVVGWAGVVVEMARDDGRSAGGVMLRSVSRGVGGGSAREVLGDSRGVSGELVSTLLGVLVATPSGWWVPTRLGGTMPTLLDLVVRTL